MSLYKVSCTFEIVVDAKNKQEAAKLAIENMYDEVGKNQPQPSNINTQIINRVSEIHESWVESIPYSSENHNRTCLDILLGSACVELKCCKCQDTTNLVRYLKSTMCKECVTNIVKNDGKSESQIPCEKER